MCTVIPFSIRLIIAEPYVALTQEIGVSLKRFDNLDLILPCLTPCGVIYTCAKWV